MVTVCYKVVCYNHLLKQVIKGLNTEICTGFVFSVAPARSIVEDLVEEKYLDPPESLGMAGDFSRLSPRYRVLVERT